MPEPLSRMHRGPSSAISGRAKKWVGAGKGWVCCGQRRLTFAAASDAAPSHGRHRIWGARHQQAAPASLDPVGGRKKARSCPPLSRSRRSSRQSRLLTSRQTRFTFSYSFHVSHLKLQLAMRSQLAEQLNNTKFPQNTKSRHGSRSHFRREAPPKLVEAEGLQARRGRLDAAGVAGEHSHERRPRE